MNSPIDFPIDGGPISLDKLDASLGRPLKPQIPESAWAKVNSARKIVEESLASDRAIYGVNTGFGKLCNKRISTDQLATLQDNLLVSHAVGVGPPIPPALVRWMLLFKINSLLAGASGIQPACIKWLAAMLDADLLPVVPTRGSLGASGDLAPLAHMVLPMIGRGQIWSGERSVPALEAMKSRGIATVRLAEKDGLALINGTQMMLSYLAEIVIRGRRLSKHADLIATITLEACRASVRPFDEGLLKLRPHVGALTTGKNVRKLMADSEILISHANCDKVQDPYSLRCIPQVHGACRDTLSHAARTLETELASVTDNPVLVGEDIISGGNFHGEPLAFALDFLTIALTEWASISERRTYMLTTGPDELPPLLMKDTGVNSGFMIPQYTAAALVNECKVLSTPASVDSIPSSLGQEDHVSMGAQSALKCRQVLENAESILAIEMLCAAQALDYRLPIKPGIGPRVALDSIRRRISHAESDREFGLDINSALDLLRSQEVLRAVENQIGTLD